MASERAERIKPFLVMDVMAQAAALERRGEHVVHMEVGEPDLPPPPHIVRAMREAVDAGPARYTCTEGLAELRDAIATRYRSRYGVVVDPERIVVTAGTSPAALLVWGALLDPGDEVVLPDPSYACYPGEIEFLGGRPVSFEVREEEGFRVDPERVATATTPRTRAVLLNSPANPTGATVEREELRELARLAETRGFYLVSDEIYHGIEYGPQRAPSALEESDRVFVQDGLSKRYGMTGWRLGWLVVPPEFVRAVRKLHQNFFISTCTFVQRAAIAALEGPEDSVAAMVREYRARRDLVVERLRALGFGVTRPPGGAFYVLADARRFGSSSVALAREILEGAKVAVTPGVDFGPRAEGCLRFSYSTSIGEIEEGFDRLGRFLAARG
jgi:aspartate aminotransferase